MGERNGEGETNRTNDRIRVQGNRGSPHSKTGKEKQQQREQKKKREEEAPKHSKVFWFGISRPIPLHLPPSNPLRPPSVLDAKIKFSPHQPWSSGYAYAEVTMG